MPMRMPKRAVLIREQPGARRHAEGYTEYAKMDGLRYHQAQRSGEDPSGIPLCVCSYPLVMTPEEKKEHARRTQATTEAGLLEQAAKIARDDPEGWAEAGRILDRAEKNGLF